MSPKRQYQPPYSFMRKGVSGPIISGFMTKNPAVLRGATLQLHPSILKPVQQKNTLERL